jgi:hypothetical protein
VRTGPPTAKELIALAGFRCNYRTQPNSCAVRLLSTLTLVLHANQLLIVFYHFWGRGAIMGRSGAAFKAGALMLVPLHLAGCMTVPDLDSIGHPLQIREVVQQVECEIYDTVLKYEDNPKTNWIVNYAAKVTLALTVSQDGSISPDGALLGPFGIGSYVIGASGSLKGTAERLATYAITIDFSKMDPFKPACEAPNPRLHGRIGFKDWFDRVVLSFDEDTYGRPSDLSHKLDFQIDAGFKLTPAYELLRSRGNSALAANITFKHSVDFVMTYNDPNAVDYSKVCVVNYPGPCYEPGKAAASRKGRRPTSVVGVPGRLGSPATLAPSVQRQLDSNTLDLQIRSLRLDQLRR